MKKATQYRGHRFPPEVISTTVWLYHRFSLSFRDVEDLVAHRGVMVSYESVRRWCLKFGRQYERVLKRREAKGSDQSVADEMYIQINGEQHYLWRAVDQDGEVVDVFLQKKRDGKAAKRFFGRLLKTHQRPLRQIVTDKLRSYGVAHRELIPGTIHNRSRYANNRAELSHQPSRVRKRVMRRFKSTQQAQRFLTVHSAVSNLFNLGRHLVSAEDYRHLRARAFESWTKVAA